MSNWVCPRCGVEKNFWDINFHECKNITPICPKCNLTKPCECDD